jgi:hypothetical protein
MVCRCSLETVFSAAGRLGETMCCTSRSLLSLSELAQRQSKRTLILVAGCPCVECNNGPVCYAFNHRCGNMLVAPRYFGYHSWSHRCTPLNNRSRLASRFRDCYREHRDDSRPVQKGYEVALGAGRTKRNYHSDNNRCSNARWSCCILPTCISPVQSSSGCQNPNHIPHFLGNDWD